MKVVYYVKIVRSLDDTGVILSFPSLPGLKDIKCKNTDEALFTAKRIVIDFCQDEEFLPLPIPFIGEEYYSIHINVD